MDGFRFIHEDTLERLRRAEQTAAKRARQARLNVQRRQHDAAAADRRWRESVEQGRAVLSAHSSPMEMLRTAKQIDRLERTRNRARESLRQARNELAARLHEYDEIRRQRQALEEAWAAAWRQWQTAASTSQESALAEAS